MIELNDFRVSYGKNDVLKGLSAGFAPGRVYGIVGENGAGKTTLFRALSGFIGYDGDLSAPDGLLTHRLGFLQTTNFLLPKITGREYLRLLCQARSVDPGDLDARNVFDLPLDNYAETYSTGMQKKLALLGVLLQQNDLLILDEPFNGVDIQSNLLITAIIASLRGQGKTVLISSHIFATLRDTCDELYLLREGRFVRHALREEFGDLEKDMEDVTVGDRVGRLFG